MEIMFLYVNKKRNQNASLIKGNLFIHKKTSQVLILGQIGHNQYTLTSIKDGDMVTRNSRIILTEEQIRNDFLCNDEWEYIQNKDVVMRIEVGGEY